MSISTPQTEQETQEPLDYNPTTTGGGIEKESHDAKDDVDDADGEGDGDGDDGEGEGDGDEGEDVSSTTTTGLKFRRFSSILNITESTVREIVLEGHTEDTIEWVITEKVHGANFSIMTDGVDFICAKRTSILKETDKFYNFMQVLEPLKPQLLNAHQILKSKYFTDLSHVTFFGELFGGIYPHRDVPAIPGVKHVQKGVYYSPSTEIYFYDIWVKGSSFLDFDTFQKVCQEASLIYSKPLKRGTYNELVQFDVNSFETLLPAQFRLPPISNNIAEGIVLKPVQNRFSSSARVIIKLKSDRFKEVTGQKKFKPPKLPKPQHDNLSPVANQHFTTLCNYITENRLRNILSKIGNDISDSDKSKIIGMLVRDAISEYSRDFPEFTKFPKEVQKSITSPLSSKVLKIVTTNWKLILSNDF